MPRSKEIDNSGLSKDRLSTHKKRIINWLTVGVLASVFACSALSAIACEPTPGLSSIASPEISVSCLLPGLREVNIAIGGLETNPYGRRIHAFEIFSYAHDDVWPPDDVHIQIWWETTNGKLTFPEDYPPIIHIDR